MAAIAAAGGAVDPDAVAAGLIDEFGSLASAAAGSLRRQLRATKGDRGTVAALRAFQHAMIHALEITDDDRPVLSGSEELLNYLRPLLAFRTTESIRLLHLNSRHRLIKDELLIEGTLDQAACYRREVMHRALDLGSAALIVAHNHPSGDPAPSKGDIELTKALMEAGKGIGVWVLDHIVIGQHGHTSLRALNVITPYY